MNFINSFIVESHFVQVQRVAEAAVLAAHDEANCYLRRCQHRLLCCFFRLRFRVSAASSDLQKFCNKGVMVYRV